jgi:hypothetical protein
VVAGPPRKLEIVGPAPSNIIVNNGMNPVGRRILLPQKIVLTDEFGNIVIDIEEIGKLQIIASVRNAEDNEFTEVCTDVDRQADEIYIDMPFFFCNDTDRAAKVLL